MPISHVPHTWNGAVQDRPESTQSTIRRTLFEESRVPTTKCQFPSQTLAPLSRRAHELPFHILNVVTLLNVPNLQYQTGEVNHLPFLEITASPVEFTFIHHATENGTQESNVKSDEWVVVAYLVYPLQPRAEEGSHLTQLTNVAHVTVQVEFPIIEVASHL